MSPPHCPSAPGPGLGKGRGGCDGRGGGGRERRGIHVFTYEHLLHSM